ncbi:hypothetical protein NW832_13575 [Synechococcus sp. R5-16]
MLSSNFGHPVTTDLRQNPIHPGWQQTLYFRDPILGEELESIPL